METVNMLDGRAMLWMDIGVYMGIILCPLVKALYRIHALLVKNNIDRSSVDLGSPIKTMGS